PSAQDHRSCPRCLQSPAVEIVDDECTSATCKGGNQGEKVSCAQDDGQFPPGDALAQRPSKGANALPVHDPSGQHKEKGAKEVAQRVFPQLLKHLSGAADLPKDHGQCAGTYEQGNNHSLPRYL